MKTRQSRWYDYWAVRKIWPKIKAFDWSMGVFGKALERNVIYQSVSTSMCVRKQERDEEKCASDKYETIACASFRSFKMLYFSSAMLCIACFVCVSVCTAQHRLNEFICGWFLYLEPARKMFVCRRQRPRWCRKRPRFSIYIFPSLLLPSFAQIGLCRLQNSIFSTHTHTHIHDSYNVKFEFDSKFLFCFVFLVDVSYKLHVFSFEYNSVNGSTLKLNMCLNEEKKMEMIASFPLFVTLHALYASCSSHTTTHTQRTAHTRGRME